MKQHTTNYTDAFIEVALDCPAASAIIPPDGDPPTQARREYEMVANHPYVYTSDDVLFETKGLPKGLSREDFFSKGQPCLRASSLTKRYGWGVHSDAQGRIALIPMESAEYQLLASDAGLRHLQAMRNSKS